MLQYPDTLKNLSEQWWYNNQPNYGYDESLFQNLNAQQPIVDKYGEPYDISSDIEI